MPYGDNRLPMKPAPKISVCMIVKDEEPNLARAIDSVRGFAFEVIVLDTGSKDRTASIALERGAKVDFFAWTGDFSEARNRAIALATGDWILSLDADEAATDPFREAWESTLAATSADGLSIPVHNIGETDSLAVVRLTRLFRSGRGYEYRGKIHEDIGTSIVAAGKTIAEADLPLVHYGYTQRENARKGRPERNLALLLAEHEAAPDAPRYWHYLGLEHARADDHDAALPLLGRMVAERPDDPLAGWSASLLSEVLSRRGDTARAWSAARFGTRSPTGRIMCLIRMGTIAAGDGDPVTPEWCASELLRIERAAVDFAQRRSTALHLRAWALWESGDRETALSSWLAAVREFPNDGFLADQYVRRLERLRGPVLAGIEATRAAPTLVVAATSVGSLVRAGDWARAVQLATRCPAQTLYTAHALLRTGRATDAIEIFRQQGEAGALSMLLWALEDRDEALAARALTGASPVWHEAASHIQRGQPVPESLHWLVWHWARTWLDFRGDAFAGRLMELGARPAHERGACCAKVLFELGRSADALDLAARSPGQPDTNEVVGLIAYGQGDFASAAAFLGRRAEVGDAPVRVYRCGADALARTGHEGAARRMWALGKDARPDSRLWKDGKPIPLT
jgi:tetratricopeptide (TPR) repeat protein